MPRTHRITDCNSANGCITSTPQSTVYANNLLVSVDGASGTPDSSCSDGNIHCSWNTANGGPTVFAELIPINKEGDADTCGHPRTAGSPNVFNDAFTGGGALYDNSAPYPDVPIPPGAPADQPVATQLDEFVQENTDVPEDPPVSYPVGTDVRPVTEQEVDEQQPVPNVPPTQDCSVVDSLPATYVYTDDEADFDIWAAGFQLSPNFTVYDLTVGPAVSTHRFTTSVTQASGLTQKQILQNLCFLAKTVLEPMRTQYGDLTITSGWRNRSGTSQHNRGQAVDIQIFGFHGTGMTGQQYYNRAQDIRDNIDYDQLILEWFGRNPWIHISTNSAGHRKSVLTQIGSSSYSPGLRRLG